MKKLIFKSFGIAAVAALAVSSLAGCSESVNMGKPSYTSTDGTVTEYKVGNRAPAVKWFGIDDHQQSLSYANLSGAVVVMNFWYAGCPPCRVETPALVDQAKQFEGKAQFVGVDVRDSLDTARAFKRTFGVTYPTILDAATGDVVGEASEVDELYAPATAKDIKAEAKEETKEVKAEAKEAIEDIKTNEKEALKEAKM